MNKSKRIFLITVIALVALYLASAIVTLGTVLTPITAWQIRTENPNASDTLSNAFVNVDVTLTKPNEEKEGETVSAPISKVYVYVGNVYSHAKDENGNGFVRISFQFKDKSENMNTHFNESFTAKVPVSHGNGGFRWVKVYDSVENGGKQIAHARAKISSPDTFDFHEVAFLDESGYLLQVTRANTGTDEQQEMAWVLTDEQDTFNSSTSKKYRLTDEELKNLGAVQALKGGVATVGENPFDTILDFIGVTVFGPIFGMRIFDCLAGLGMIILAYAVANKLFGSQRSSILSLVFALTLGACFTASNFSLCSVGGFFAVLSIYLAINHFINHYYSADSADGISSLIGMGISYGLAISFDFAYSYLVLGLIAILVMASRRGYKEYKKEDKKAQGLEKETLFLAYRKKKIVGSLLSLVALVVIPTALFTASYSVCSGVYKIYYGSGYFISAIKHLLASLTPAYQSNPLALFVGFGGVEMNGFYSFTNYFVSILSLVAFLFVTVALIFGKKIPFLKDMGRITNKYKLLTVALVSTALPVFLGLNSSPYGFASLSVFFVIYIAFAEEILSKCLKTKWVEIAVDVSACVSVIIFGMAYVGYVGLALPEVANKILYLWQVL